MNASKYFLLAIALCVFAKDSYTLNGISPCVTPDMKPGVCVNVRYCPSLILMLKSTSNGSNPVSETTKAFLRESKCGMDGEDTMVCCPTSLCDRDQLQCTMKCQCLSKPQKPVKTFINKNADLLPTECGLHKSDRIFGGNSTSIFEYPWMALLAYDDDGRQNFKCSGVIINSFYIITAAHCVLSNRNKLIGVRVGEHDISTEKDCEGPRNHQTCAPDVQDILIDKQLVHPLYNPRKRDYDIALLRLSWEINLILDNIFPICLPLTKELRDVVNAPNKQMIVAGWGFTENKTVSSKLLQVDLPVVPIEQCSKAIKVEVSERQICAGGRPNEDACAGDSGGPLMALESLEQTNNFVLHGIVSYGPKGCGTLGKPGVYTRVGYFMDWILDTLEP